MTEPKRIVVKIIVVKNIFHILYSLYNSRLSTPGPNIKFSDPVKSVRAEAQKLKGQGVSILIALGHAGYSVDKKIADEVKELDLVVGGHTNTFLWNGKKIFFFLIGLLRLRMPYSFFVKHKISYKKKELL